MAQVPPTITFNGKDYTIDKLPQDVQGLISLYSKWEGELREARVESFKLEAALKGISIEIETRMSAVESTPPEPAPEA